MAPTGGTEMTPARAMEFFRRFQGLVASSRGIYWEAEADTFRFTYVCENAEPLMGYPRDAWSIPGFWAEHIHVEDREAALAYCMTCTTNLANHELEYRFLTQDGRTLWIRDMVNVLVQDGVAPTLQGLMLDVTSQKRVELAAVAASETLERTGALAKVGGWEFDLASQAVTWSAQTCRIHDVEVSTQPTFEQAIAYFQEDGPLLTAAVNAAIHKLQPWDLQVRMTTALGRKIWVRTKGGPVVEAGKVTKLVGAIQDVTDQRQVELALAQALQEKMAFLEELHHRVKNNLQVIASLITLESDRAEPPVQRVMDELGSRIRSMSILHDLLQVVDGIVQVDLGSYLRQVVTAAVHTRDYTDCTLRLDLASIFVHMDLATPCGLLVNELVSNCIKHGISGKANGEIVVMLHLDQPGLLRLQVSDNGIGLPSDLDERSSRSIGLQLVRGLAKQLGGSLDIGSGPHAVFSVVFPAR